MNEQGGYFVFVLQARGAAETQLLKMHAETPESERWLRDRFSKVKANWAPRDTFKTELGGMGE